MKKNYLAALVFYSLVVVAVFGPALFPPAGQMIYGDDIHHQYYFYREFFNNWLKQGIFPWWNPYNFAGVPFIANPIANIWYPPTWLFTLLPLNVAYSWHLALHILWAMVGMYVLLRCLSSRPLSRDPINKLLDSSFRWNDMHVDSWVAGLIFGLSGFFMARVWAGHVDIVAAASWMPWVVAAFAANFKFQISNFKLEDQAYKQKQRHLIVIASLTFAAQLLSGYHTMALFTLEAVGLMTLFFCFRQRSAAPAIRAILAVLFGIGLAAIQLLPEVEFVRQTIRTYDLPYAWASYGSTTWESLKQLLNPFFFGNQFTFGGPPPNFIEHAAFIGRVGLGLAVFGALASRSVFLAIAVFGLWVSLGPNAAVDLQKILWNIFPVYHSLRIPPRHLILFVFAASILAAKGFSFARSLLAKLVVSLAVVAEMVVFARQFVELRSVPEAREDKELIAILKQDALPYRLLQNFGVWLPQREALAFDATMSKGIFSATGYDISILKSYYEFIDTAAGNKESSILAQDVQIPYFNGYRSALDVLNIKYIMVPRQYDPFAGMKLLREDAIGDYRLYENTSVLPRFYFPDKKAVVVQTYSPNEIVLKTDNPRDEILMSSEVYYPGWEAYVDGKKTDITKGNNAFRTLFVPAGSHTVIFRFVPKSVALGAGVSIATVAFLILFLRNQNNRGVGGEKTQDAGRKA